MWSVVQGVLEAAEEEDPEAVEVGLDDDDDDEPAPEPLLLPSLCEPELALALD